MAVDLLGAVACVTGGARGIGKEIGRSLATAGAQVWLGDIDAEAVTTTAAELGGRVRACPVDVSDPESFRLFLTAPGRPVTMLVNNAGVMHLGAFADLPLRAHLAEIAVDLTGVVIGMRLALPAMLARDHGHIVNVASMAARLTVPGAATYSAAKSAVAALSRAVRAEIAGSGVTITTVLPSAVRTELTSGVPTRGVPTLDPTVVAAAVVASTRHGRPEVVLPRWAGAAGILESVLPEPVFEGVKRAAGGRRLLDRVDPSERRSYRTRTVDRHR